MTKQASTSNIVPFKDASPAVLAMVAKAETLITKGNATVQQGFAGLAHAVMVLHADDLASGATVARMNAMYAAEKENKPEAFASFFRATADRILGKRPKHEEGDGDSKEALRVYRNRYAQLYKATERAVALHMCNVFPAMFDAATSRFTVPLHMFNREGMETRYKGDVVTLDNPASPSLSWVAAKDAPNGTPLSDKMPATTATLFTLCLDVARAQRGKKGAGKKNADKATVQPNNALTDKAAQEAGLWSPATGNLPPAPHTKGNDGDGRENVKTLLVTIGKLVKTWKEDTKAGPVTRDNIIAAYGDVSWSALQEIAALVNSVNAQEAAKEGAKKAA